VKIFIGIIYFAAVFAIHAEDAKQVPPATVEQLQKQVAEQSKEIAKLNDQLSKSQQKLTIYQQSAFRCQDAMLDAQIEAQSKQAEKPKTK